MEEGKKEILIDLENLSIKEMFAHIIQRLKDRDKEVRKKGIWKTDKRSQNPKEWYVQSKRKS